MRYDLGQSAGSDAIHSDPRYSYAVCKLIADNGKEGVGLAFTLGKGNELVCKAIEYLSEILIGKDLDEITNNWGSLSRQISDHPHLRWLGPHKGVVHLALASITNAVFDLWAKEKGVPLWKLLIDLEPETIINLLDFRYVDDELSKDEAREILTTRNNSALDSTILKNGYPGYDTSIGWINYSNKKIVENAKIAVGNGFTAMKMKVGLKDSDRDIHRANLIRNTVGDKVKLMFDANQQWDLAQAVKNCNRLKDINPFWIEEPLHPDDIIGHQTLAKEIAPIKIAAGEHVPNKIMFKNYLQTKSLGFNQVDAVRVGGVSEFILISLLSRKFGVPVYPHVGDMGQIHQHLVLFNHIKIGHPVGFLEYIPHIRKHFIFPAKVEGGLYQVPQEPGSSSDLVEIS